MGVWVARGGVLIGAMEPEFPGNPGLSGILCGEREARIVPTLP